ncbi:unnamed protein product [Chrysoparadoxa australica]
MTWQRYKLSLDYIGSAFYGVVRQPAQHHGGGKRSRPVATPTVEASLRETLNKFVGATNHKDLCFSSRTDRGVHAMGNSLHVDLRRKKKKKRRCSRDEESFHGAHHSPETVRSALNALALQKGQQWRVADAEAVGSDFHARFCAESRDYMYRIIFPSPESCKGWPRGKRQPGMFERDRAWLVNCPLDVNLMGEAAGLLVGTHDFSSFRGSGCQMSSPVRTIDLVDIKHGCGELMTQDKGAMVVQVNVRASGYLYRMVRNIVSGETVAQPLSSLFISVQIILSPPNQSPFCYTVLVAAGSHKMKVADVQSLLEARDRRKGPAPAPAHGLYLTGVNYSTYSLRERMKEMGYTERVE